MALPVVVLLKGRARPFWFGSPIVFSGAIAEVRGDPEPGDLVEVRDAEGRLIGHGFFNPASQYRVRIVRQERAGEPPPDPGEILAARLAAAARARAAFGLPGPATDCYRLANSEGDGVSGLTVDVYGSTAVVLASALWVERRRAAVEAAVRAVVPGASIVHRVSNSVRREEGLAPAPPASPDAAGGPVAVVEGGIRHEVEVRHGQKTGFYLDQRDNRALVRSLASGRRVLDAFCFTGGFALAAAAGGAAEASGVDSSGPAIEAARRNAAANGLDRTRFEEADVAAVLASGRRWDVVVVDPPKLAGSRTDLGPARERYRRVNRDACRAVEPGGLLVTCSCSSALRRGDFLEVLRDASMEAGRRLAVTHVLGAAPDHPVHPSWPEGEYLKCVVAVVH